MITILILGIIALGAIALGLRVIDKRINEVNRELKLLKSISFNTNNSFEVKKELENLKRLLKQVEQQGLNTREIMQDKTEEIKRHITCEKKDMFWKYISTESKLSLMKNNVEK